MIEFSLRSASKEEKERKTSSPSKPRSSRPRTAPLSGNHPKKVKQILHHFWNLPHRPSKVDQQIWVCQARVEPSQGGEQGQDGFQGDENFNRWDWDIFLLQKSSDSAEYRFRWVQVVLGAMAAGVEIFSWLLFENCPKWHSWSFKTGFLDSALKLLFQQREWNRI